MSDFDLDDNLILDYLAECRDHLATIETDLLSMEQSGAAIDGQLVNRVFRAAHAIRGGAGFFDLPQIKELAHRTESVLDLVRSGQMAPTSTIVGILLLAFDKLSQLILDYRNSNDADLSEFTNALSSLAEEHLSPDKKSSTREIVSLSIPNTGRLICASAFDLDQARSNGRTTYVIEFDLIHDIQRRGQTPLDVLNHLMKCGVILATVLDLDSAGTLDDEPSNQLLLDVLYATLLDNYSLSLILDVRPERIHRIVNNSVATTLTGAATATMEPAQRESAGVGVTLPTSPEPPDRLSERSPALTLHAETAVRLNLSFLDSLVRLAGELVLAGNQLNEAVLQKDEPGIGAGIRRVSLVTFELQEAVTLTRMAAGFQPVLQAFEAGPGRGE